MYVARISPLLLFGCAVLFATSSQNAAAATLCVNPGGSGGCHSKIQAAVNAASPFDVINVGPGTYKEDVTIGIPISLLGAGAGVSNIDATGLPNAIYVDGLDHLGLSHVTIAGFKIENAQYEGILVVSASDVTIRENWVNHNDKFGPVFSQDANCAGQPSFETDESGDCGGAIHFIGTRNSIISGNSISYNADGILISDETAESHDNLVIGNTVTDNPLDCGIVLASHPPYLTAGPAVHTNAQAPAAHFGVVHNTILENTSANNGVKIGGAGVGVFADGNGQGTAKDNVIIHNTLIGNGLGGVTFHSHVGPTFGALADDLDGNQIIGNYIAGNLADKDDTATPGRVGININSGGGGTPIWGTVISQNVILDEDIDIAINTPAIVDLHLNSLEGGKIGVANVCAFDKTSCTGSIAATENYWGCAGGPGKKGCTTTSGGRILSAPWLSKPAYDAGPK